MIGKAIIIKSVFMNGLGTTIEYCINSLETLMSLLAPNKSQISGREQAARFKERDDLKVKLLELVNHPSMIQNGNGSLFKTFDMYLKSTKEKWCDQRTYAVTNRGGPFYRSQYLFQIQEERRNLYPRHLTAHQILLCMRPNTSSLVAAAQGWPDGHNSMLGLRCVYYLF